MATRNQGEGDREAARHYNEATEEFVESGKVQQQQEDRKNISEAEKAELERAEEAGKDRSHEHDPAVSRDYSKPS